MSHGRLRHKMSSLDRLLKNRRSIRRYKPDIPPSEWIEEMIVCATHAPSPMNSGPVRFIKIGSEKIRAKIHEDLQKGHTGLLQEVEATARPKKLKNRVNAYFRFSRFMFDAPLLFAVGVTDYTGFSKRLVNAGIIDSDPRSDTDMDIATGLSLMSFILKGEEFGLGSCILTAPLVFIPGIGQIQEFSHIRIQCFLTTGFPDETPSHIERKSLSEIYMEV